jgi:hypothetical protein
MVDVQDIAPRCLGWQPLIATLQSDFTARPNLRQLSYALIY